MSLTQEQAKHLATLSRLALSPETLLSHAKSLGDTIGYVDMLNAVAIPDAIRALPDPHMLVASEDTTHSSLLGDALLAQSHHKKMSGSIVLGGILHAS